MAKAEPDIKSILLDLATKFATVSGGPFAGLGVAKVAEALGRLHIGNYFPNEPTKDTPLADIITALAKAQSDADIKDEIGALGPKTLDWLVFAKRCWNRLQRSRTDFEGKDLPDAEEDPSNPKKPLEIRYFVEKLPTISSGSERNADKLLQAAWESWSIVCGLIATEIKEAGKRKNANVIITVKDIDGPSNILADAHVGPPTHSQLILAFDEAEPWDSDKFQGTACHEMGHLLGLEHSSEADQIMAAVYAGTRKVPNANGDGKLAQRFWGPPPPERERPKSEGGFGSG